jgi:uncharacterized membrane protein
MSGSHPNARLEALSDGVFAIALTLLVLDLKVPATARIATSAELWRALGALAPSVFAFVLSFAIILITWVNHNAVLRLVDKSSSSFIYANGFLLLTVVVLPFPTGLLGAFLGTDHAAPAVVLYNGVLAVLAVGWILVCTAALEGGLTANARATAAMRVSNRNGLGAVAFYALLAGLAFWFPLTIAVVTTVSWIFWLALGIKMKPA